MSECIGEDCKDQSHGHRAAIVQQTAPIKKETKIEQLNAHPKAQAPMTIGVKLYLEKACSAFFEGIKAEFGDLRANVSKSFTEYTKTIAESHHKYREETLAKMNEALGVVDKKFSSMYGVLVNKFLLKQEQKVFAAECAVQALIEEVSDRLYQPTEAVPTVEQFREIFQSSIEKRMLEIRERVQKEADDRRKAAEAAEAAKKTEGSSDGVAVQPEAKAAETTDQPKDS